MAREGAGDAGGAAGGAIILVSQWKSVKTRRNIMNRFHSQVLRRRNTVSSKNKQRNKNHPANSCGLDGLKSSPNAFIPNKKMQEQERTAEDACNSKEERRESPKPSLQKTIPLAFAPFFLGGSACTVAGNQKQLTRKLLKQRSEQNMENKIKTPR